MPSRNNKNNTPQTSTGQHIKNLMRTSSIFDEINDTALDDILPAVVIHHYPRHGMIFSEGDPAHGFFILGTGKVKLFNQSDEGKEQILMVAAPGDSFGELSMFVGGKFAACAEALEESEVLSIDRDRFVSHLEKNPHLALNLIVRLSAKLRSLVTLIDELSLSDVTTRVAHYLVNHLGSEQRKDSRRPVQIILSEKKQVLASQLGTIPETLSRSLAKLSREGIIHVNGPQIDILDMIRLRQMAE
jgi:CRP/FNR family transcriptional regulator, dissimilatory nitrate respiration regulator